MRRAYIGAALVVYALAFPYLIAFTYSSPGDDGFIAGETVTHTHMNELDTALDGLQLVDALVGTATSALSGEIVVGTTPGGILGGTWASPTLDDLAVTEAKLNSEDFGDFTCGASADDCTVDANAITAAKVASDVATQAELDAHVNDSGDAHDASAISYAGGTGLGSTDVEAAVDELADEKANLTDLVGFVIDTNTVTPGVTSGALGTIHLDSDATANNLCININGGTGWLCGDFD